MASPAVANVSPVAPIVSPVTLYQGARGLGCINASPFCIKTEFFLRHFNIPYTAKGFSPRLAPRGKMPFLQDGQECITDSENIIDHLSAKHGIEWDAHLSAEQKHISHLIRRTLEEGSYFAILWNRWGNDSNWDVVKKAYFADLPPVVRSIVPEILRKQVRRTAGGQGIALYSQDEVIRDLNRDLNAITHFMSDSGPYFFGGKLSRVDLCVFGFLNSFLRGQIPDPYQTTVDENHKLNTYVDRLTEKYFSDLTSASTTST